GVAFFFSSRRRHTGYAGDWSSDVCSSDLERSSLQALYDVSQERVARVDVIGREDRGHPREVLAASLVPELEHDCVELAARDVGVERKSVVEGKVRKSRAGGVA